MKRTRAWLCLMTSLLMLPILPGTAAAQAFSLASGAQAGYDQYLQAHSAALPAAADILLPAADCRDRERCSLEEAWQGRTGVLLFQEGSAWAQWRIDVPQGGLYAIELAYFPLEGHSRDMEAAFTLDGATPYAELGKCVLPRIWRDSGAIVRDNRGNDVRSQKEEAAAWRTYSLKDADGMYNGLLQVYLPAGTHVLRLTAGDEPFAVSGLRLYGVRELPGYDGVMAAWMAENGELRGREVPPVTISAEVSFETSSPVLYPISDRGDPNTESRGEANSASKVRLNTIGGIHWKFAGQWISWRFSVSQPGFYKLALKARQNFTRGMLSSRRLLVDGKTPFQELECLEFPYSVNWQTVVPGRQGARGFEPYLVYLEAGEHELAIEAVPGRAADLLRTTRQTVLELNTLYRKIIMVTGTNPDPYQDYYLERKVPGLLEGFSDLSARLRAQVAHLEALTGVQGSEASLLTEIAIQLESMIRKPDTIPARLDNLRGNISSLGTWILSLKEQPLELDAITLLGEGAAVPAAGAALFSRLYFGLAGVAQSFFQDYSSVGNVYEEREALNIWISQADISASGSSSGRDQAQVIKRLIDDSFTADTGIPVNLNLVDSSQTLQQAVMGHKGPDVALTLPEATPINLAMRGALADISQFPDFQEVAERFYASALVPYRYQNGVYALPETQVFNMLFYRTDIFAELGLEPPDTWEEFYQVMKTLQKNNLQVGIPESQEIFEMFLFQKGGQFYKDGLRSTAFDQPQALEAFTEWTGLYKNHGLPLSFDFYNRFRTGEMPAGITGCSFYNTLSVAAPELRGLWRMVPVPGTPAPDGSLNRMESSYGTAAVILSDAKRREDAWTFLKWWTSAEVQARYGLELEYLIGAAARYNTANRDAFTSLPWSADERESLERQWEQVWDVPQLPGNYFTNRNLQFAFRRVVYYYENERETLFRYNEEINQEILRKREEFGLE